MKRFLLNWGISMVGVAIIGIILWVIAIAVWIYPTIGMILAFLLVTAASAVAMMQR